MALSSACSIATPSENSSISPVNEGRNNPQVTTVARSNLPQLLTSKSYNSLGTNCPRSVKHLVDTATNLNKLPEEYILPQRPEEPTITKTSAIPVIDLSGLDGPTDSRRPIVEAISAACSDWGFFMVTNHGVGESLMESMLTVAEEFHELSIEEKERYSSDDAMYPVRFGTSLQYGNSLVTSEKHQLLWRDYLIHLGEAYIHLWPTNPPNYRAVAKEYLEKLSKLNYRLFGAISEGLGLEQDFIEKSFAGGMQKTAANYYPRCPEPAQAMGLGAHTDNTPLTILMTNGINGLQIKHDGEWFMVNHVPGSLIVNIGDILEILSNGKYKSVEHRASVNVDRTRMSMAFAVLPPLGAVIEPASPLISEKSKSKFRPIVFEQYTRLSREKVYISGKSALQAIMVEETEDISSI